MKIASPIKLKTKGFQKFIRNTGLNPYRLKTPGKSFDSDFKLQLLGAAINPAPTFHEENVFINSGETVISRYLTFLKILATIPKFKGKELPEFKNAPTNDVPSKAPVDASSPLFSWIGWHDAEPERVKPSAQV